MRTLPLVAVVATLAAGAVLLATGDAGATSGSPVDDVTTTTAVVRPTPVSPEVRDVLPVKTGRTRPVVVLYGDSLAWEARYEFTFSMSAAGADVRARTLGGTAICDFLGVMRQDATELQPDAVVVEFSGNAMTPCMRGSRPALAGLEPIEAYRNDAEDVLRLFPGARVYFVGSPKGPPGRPGEFHGGSMNAMYQQVVGRHPSARYVDAGASVLDHGRWTKTLPCLSGEPCTGGTDGHGRGVNVVRAPDGSHFCPGSRPAVQGVTAPCSVWSSGAHRFGTAMSAAVIADLPS